MICDSEESYTRKLAEALLLKKEVTMGVRLCSSLEMLERLLEIGQIQVLLISEEVPYEKRKQVFAGKRIVLTRQHCADLGAEENELRKYQSVDRLSAEILKAFQETSGAVPFLKKKKGELLAVYSPIHRIGKTTFALKLGKQLALQENVLYLNLETYAGMGGYFKEEDAQNFSHLLYYAKQEKDDISVRIASMVRRMGNLDYIPPMKVWTDLRFVQRKEWEQFFEKLMDQSVYDVIILDMGNVVENVFEVLNMCDHILLLQADDVYAKAKLEQYRYMVRVLGFQELEKRTLIVDMEKPLRQTVRTAAEELNRWRGREKIYASGGTTS